MEITDEAGSAFDATGTESREMYPEPCDPAPENCRFNCSAFCVLGYGGVRRKHGK